LIWLEFTKKRHGEPLSGFCDEYVKLVEEKEVLDAIKADARAKLDTYSGSVVDTYRKSINTYLKTFTAGFHLDQMKVGVFRPRAELHVLRRHQRYTG